MPHFLYQNRLVHTAQGDPPAPQERQIMSDHFHYLEDSLKAGELVLAGPCLDLAFGIVIFEADSEEAARRFMENDPAIRQGFMTAELHPFRVSLIRGA